MCGSIEPRDDTYICPSTHDTQNNTKQYAGSSLGIALGCLLGMLPLLFITHTAKEEHPGEVSTCISISICVYVSGYVCVFIRTRLSHHTQYHNHPQVFHTLAHRAAALLGCQHAVVYHLDPATGQVLQEYSSGGRKQVRPYPGGLVWFI